MSEDILTTDDGLPIGSITLTNGRFTGRAPTHEEDSLNARAELLRSQAAELTESPDADTAILEMYPDYFDREKRVKAMKMFIVGQKSLSDIAEQMGVPIRTVSQWSYDGKWIDMVERELYIRQAESRIELARIRAERRARVAREQLEAAEMIRSKVTSEIDDMSAKTAAEALKSAADVEARILGIKETGETAETSQSEESKKADGKVPLVVVFNGNASGTPTLRRVDADI